MTIYFGFKFNKVAKHAFDNFVPYKNKDKNVPKQALFLT